MIEKLLNILNLVASPAIFFASIFFAISFLWGKLFLILNLKKYSEKQRIHKNEIPRFGGLIIFIYLITVGFFYYDNALIKILLLCSIPIIFIGLIEDIFHNTKPRTRLFYMLFASTVFLVFMDTNFPTIDIPIINYFFDFQYFNLIFFSFCMLIVINGSNLVDGVNGNLAFTILTQLTSLFFLSQMINDHSFNSLVLFISIPYLIFLIFNFPFCKIFFGDLGAYFSGFMISALTIFFYGTHPEIPSWGAVLVLFYPCIELLFSFIRKKVFENKSPMSADLNHLHSIIHIFFAKKGFHLNSLITIILFPMWLLPVMIIFIYDSILLIFLLLIFLILLYLLLYFIFRNLTLKKNV